VVVVVVNSGDNFEVIGLRFVDSYLYLVSLSL